MTRKKTGGRAKGVPNKTTKQLKTLVHDFISENWDSVLRDFKSTKLHPRDRLNFIERMLKYCIPIIGSNNAKLEIKQIENLSDADFDKLVSKIIELTTENNIE